MLSLTFVSLFCVSLVVAQNSVAGHPRISESDVQFTVDALSDSVSDIVQSVHEGPNRTSAQTLPVPKLYGVNYGNWLVSEAWMSPNEWTGTMQGEICNDCSTCRQTMWSLTKFLGQSQANSVFKQHWQSWLTQTDVDEIKSLGLNSVRIPLGFWLVEDIVDTSTEFYPQGGLDELIRGLTMFKAAGIHVVLDHHALPGVAASNQMFAGNCTTLVDFYTSPGKPTNYNYQRAITWSIVMAYLSHVHPAFSTVFSLEAVNEPLMNANKTPGLGAFGKSFVLGIRAIEFTLGIICDDTFASGILTDTLASAAFKDALPIILKLSLQYGIRPVGGLGNILGSLIGSNGSLMRGGLGGVLGGEGRQRHCLATQFMNKDWQYNNPSNPSDNAHGPQLYDNHLYFNFGGVAPEATADSYLQTLCSITRVQDSAAEGDAPLYFGEWSLGTQFTANTTFLQQYGDAQKLMYSQGAGWLFWNWKVDSEVNQNLQWSYRDAANAGLFTPQPDQYFDENVCAPYLNA